MSGKGDGGYKQHFSHGRKMMEGAVTTGGRLENIVRNSTLFFMTKRHIDMFLEELQRRENFNRYYQRGDNNKVRIQRNQESWAPEPRDICFPRDQRLGRRM